MYLKFFKDLKFIWCCYCIGSNLARPGNVIQRWVFLFGRTENSFFDPEPDGKLLLWFLSRTENSFFPRRRKGTRQPYKVFHKKPSSHLLGRLILILFSKCRIKGNVRCLKTQKLSTDYSSACFICGVVFATWEGFSKHKRTQSCSNHLHQLLTVKSMGVQSKTSHN